MNAQPPADIRTAEVEPQAGLCWFQVPQINLGKLGKTPELLEHDGKYSVSEN